MRKSKQNKMNELACSMTDTAERKLETFAHAEIKSASLRDASVQTDPPRQVVNPLSKPRTDLAPSHAHNDDRPTMQLVSMTPEGIISALATLISSHETAATNQRVRADRLEREMASKDKELSDLRHQVKLLTRDNVYSQVERKVERNICDELEQQLQNEANGADEDGAWGV